jgi:hypothetical protein
VSGAAIVEMLGICEAIAAEAARSKAAMSRGPG